jgi:hypothetical protein
VVVKNRRDQLAERTLGALYTDPGPRPPIIAAVNLDLASHRIYANVASSVPTDPNSEIEWVRAYHGGLPGTFVELEAVPNAFEDPNGFVAELPPAFASSNIEVVAYVAANVYSRHRVTENEVTTARVAGAIQLAGHIDTTGNDEEWNVPRFDLDNGSYLLYQYEADDWSDGWNPLPPWDLWVMVDESSTGWFHVNGSYLIVPSAYSYEDLTPEVISGLVPSETAPLQINAATGIQSGDVLAIVTTDGRYSKARVVSIGVYDNGWTNAYDRTVALEYVTFELPPPPIIDRVPSPASAARADRSSLPR